MKTFFDGVFIDRSRLMEEGIKYPIKLEYFKTSEEENVETKYGIEVVKTEYIDGDIRTETKTINNLTNSVIEQEKILNLLKSNEVTPIAVEDVLDDIL